MSGPLASVPRVVSGEPQSLSSPSDTVALGSLLRGGARKPVSTRGAWLQQEPSSRGWVGVWGAGMPELPEPLLARALTPAAWPHRAVLAGDVDAFRLLLEMKLRRRRERPSLPHTVTELVAEDGSRVYVVGTAHFSDDSKRDVVKVGTREQPDHPGGAARRGGGGAVPVPRGHAEDGRAHTAAGGEGAQRGEAAAGRQNGVMSGLMQMLLLKVSAHITEQLGMAPGGEFREAFKEASKVPFCKFHLGDRPLPVTFKRAIAALSFWQKVKLAWGLCFLSDPISKDDVERCKQKDLLEQMMAEMIGEFPDLHRTIVSERDVYLTYMLRQAARRLELPRASEAEPRQCVPSVVVGVVGMGHVPGIEKNWGSDLNIQEVMTVPPPSVSGRVSRLAVKAAALGLVGYGLYWVGRRAAGLVLALPAAQSCLQRVTAARPQKSPGAGPPPVQIGLSRLRARLPRAPHRRPAGRPHLTCLLLPRLPAGPLPQRVSLSGRAAWQGRALPRCGGARECLTAGFLC
ncbi:traB domain-containing protein [Choloepus didactylus]|uniref:traB domain-containing protein n=1 Tax=Choloepus didactylus TaxID=27675 RepID=UPI00189D648C|nr:traB domain-containing protein [Choloepus didactylus]